MGVSDFKIRVSEGIGFKVSGLHFRDSVQGLGLSLGLIVKRLRFRVQVSGSRV